MNGFKSSCFTSHPGRVVLEAAFVGKDQAGPGTDVTYAGGNHSSVLFLPRDWSKLPHKIYPVLENALLLGLCIPRRLKLVIKLPGVVLAVKHEKWSRNRILHVGAHEAQPGCRWVFCMTRGGESSICAERQVLHIVNMTHPHSIVGLLPRGIVWGARGMPEVVMIRKVTGNWSSPDLRAIGSISSDTGSNTVRVKKST